MSDFDNNIRKFFKFLKKVTKENLNFSILSNLKNFISIYERGKEKEIQKLFKELFETYKDDIEKSSDNWLKNNEVEINISSSNKNAKIQLSKIYRICIDTKNNYESKLSEFMKEMKEIKEQYKQLLYPTIFLFHCYRLFSSIFPENQKVKEISCVLENMIINTNSSSNKETVNNPIANIQLTQIIPKIMNSDATRNLLMNIVNKVDINECNDVSSLMDQILKTTSDPELLSNFDSLFKTMFSTIQGSSENNNNNINPSKTK
jgi:hypothetical protein